MNFKYIFCVWLRLLDQVFLWWSLAWFESSSWFRSSSQAFKFCVSKKTPLLKQFGNTLFFLRNTRFFKGFRRIELWWWVHGAKNTSWDTKFPDKQGIFWKKIEGIDWIFSFNGLSFLDSAQTNKIISFLRVFLISFPEYFLWNHLFSPVIIGSSRKRCRKISAVTKNASSIEAIPRIRYSAWRPLPLERKATLKTKFFAIFESRSQYKDWPIGWFSPSPFVVWRSVLWPGGWRILLLCMPAPFTESFDRLGRRMILL